MWHRHRIPIIFDPTPKSDISSRLAAILDLSLFSSGCHGNQTWQRNALIFTALLDTDHGKISAKFQLCRLHSSWENDNTRFWWTDARTDGGHTFHQNLPIHMIEQVGVMHKYQLLPPYMQLQSRDSSPKKVHFRFTDHLNDLDPVTLVTLNFLKWF